MSVTFSKSFRKKNVCGEEKKGERTEGEREKK